MRAKSCGLFVVSTAVGGVPEVLPRPMIKFAEPTVEDLTDALSDAIPLARKVVPSDFHAKVSRKPPAAAFGIAAAKAVRLFGFDYFVVGCFFAEAKGGRFMGRN